MTTTQLATLEIGQPEDYPSFGQISPLGPTVEIKDKDEYRCRFISKGLCMSRNGKHI